MGVTGLPLNGQIDRHTGSPADCWTMVSQALHVVVMLASMRCSQVVAVLATRVVAMCGC